MNNGPDEYCPGCTWFTNNVPSTAPALLAARDVTWMTVSNMPLEQIERYWAHGAGRMPFASSRGTTFSDDTGAGRSSCSAASCATATTSTCTYNTKGRGVDRLAFVTSLLDLTVYGRQEPWEDSPPGWPKQPPPTEPNTMELENEPTSFGRFR